MIRQTTVTRTSGPYALATIESAVRLREDERPRRKGSPANEPRNGIPDSSRDQDARWETSMNPIILLAALAFLVACIWSAIQRAWPLAFLAGGLFLVALNATSILTF